MAVAENVKQNHISCDLTKWHLEEKAWEQSYSMNIDTSQKKEAAPGHSNFPVL